MTDYSKVGKRIRYYRKKNGYTLEQLAFEIQSSASYISNIERAVKKPSLHKLQQIADTLGVPITKLITPSSLPPAETDSYPSDLLPRMSESDRTRLINNLYEIINILEQRS